jgi:hypothetical protein
VPWYTHQGMPRWISARALVVIGGVEQKVRFRCMDLRSQTTVLWRHFRRKTLSWGRTDPLNFLLALAGPSPRVRLWGVSRAIFRAATHRFRWVIGCQVVILSNRWFMGLKKPPGRPCQMPVWYRFAKFNTGNGSLYTLFLFMP